MNTRLFRLFGLILILGLLFSTRPLAVRANGGKPPAPPAPFIPPQPPDHPSHGRPQPESGHTPTVAQPAGRVTASNQVMSTPSGVPDDYGYSWANLPGYAWIDASTGTNTGVTSTTDVSGPINLGFPFSYYGNAYSQLYVTRYGYVALSLQSKWYASGEVPFPESPDNLVAPYRYPTDAVTGYVRYKTGGTAPNRWFVVEWNRVVSNFDGTDEFTFEVVLRENGDIDFQYGAMTLAGGWFCPSSGIEDAYGTDGLAITGFCTTVAGSHAVRISHPATQAHLKVDQAEQGTFTHAGGTAEFEISIKNNGTGGADVYDITPASPWAVTLFAADGTTPLTNTAGGPAIDTGSISQGSTKTIVAKVATPGGAVLGNSNTAALEICSSLDSNRCKTVTLQSAIPTSFAQVYTDGYDGIMKLDLIKPGGQANLSASAETGGRYPAVAEAPNGNFFYVWTNGGCNAGCAAGVDNLQYTVLDRYGLTVHTTAYLTNHSSATYQVFDWAPAVAVTPDGHVGVLWQQYEYRSIDSDNQWRYNIWFAVLDSAGTLSYGPVNVTNYTTWGSSNSGVEVPEFHTPVIAATGDNRFVLSWTSFLYNPCSFSDCGVENIYYAVLNASGATIKGITQFTYDAPNNSGEAYYRSRLNTLSGNRALITWSRNSDYDVYYAVLDSAGNLVKGQTSLSNDGPATSDWEADAAQLPDGKIVVAWMGGGWWQPDRTVIRFAVLNSSYNLVVSPTTLANAMDITGEAYVSVAADQNGRAALTWTDWSYYYRHHLYYALVDGSGSVLTPPVISRTSKLADHYSYMLSINYAGFGNTTYSSVLAAGVDTAAWPSRSLSLAAPGSDARIAVNYINQGQTQATGVTLTATLAAGLTYSGDTSGITPAVVGNVVTWDLPDLAFLDGAAFDLYVGVPAMASLGDRFGVTLAIGQNETEANPLDNSADLDVAAATQVFLPSIMR